MNNDEFTQDWGKFLEEAKELEEQAEEEARAEDPNYAAAQQNNVVGLSIQQARILCDRVSGRKENGEKKANVAYVSYIERAGMGTPSVINEPADLRSATVTVLPFSSIPQFYTIDIEFPSPDDMDLKKFWAVFEKYRKNELGAKATEIPMFYVNIQENLSEDELINAEDVLLCCFYNPLLAYLTRSNPEQKAPEEVTEQNEIIGGNIVRMLVHTDCVNFHLMDKGDFMVLDETPVEIIENNAKEENLSPVDEEPDIIIPPGYYDMDEDE